VRATEAFSLKDRFATDNSPRTKYQRRQGEAKTVDHWGQRKLLLSEIEFLTMYGDAEYTVVYAGNHAVHEMIVMR
jgi:hypothetical protein